MYSTTISWKKNVKSFKHQQKQLPYVKISLSKVQLTTCEASTGTSALLAWSAWMEFLVSSGTSTPTAKMSTSSLKDKSAAPEADLDVSRQVLVPLKNVLFIGSGQKIAWHRDNKKMKIWS
jgi:hypothetical protein